MLRMKLINMHIVNTIFFFKSQFIDKTVKRKKERMKEIVRNNKIKGEGIRISNEGCWPNVKASNS